MAWGVLHMPTRRIDLVVVVFVEDRSALLPSEGKHGTQGRDTHSG